MRQGLLAAWDRVGFLKFSGGSEYFLSRGWMDVCASVNRGRHMPNFLHHTLDRDTMLDGDTHICQEPGRLKSLHQGSELGMWQGSGERGCRREGMSEGSEVAPW